jgi:hypothetical protein
LKVDPPIFATGAGVGCKIRERTKIKPRFWDCGYKSG